MCIGDRLCDCPGMYEAQVSGSEALADDVGEPGLDDIHLTTAQPLHFGFVHLSACDVVPEHRKASCRRQPDVAGSHHSNTRGQISLLGSAPSRWICNHPLGCHQ